jgi:hypothetical protein
MRRRIPDRQRLVKECLSVAISRKENPRAQNAHGRTKNFAMPLVARL